MSYELFVCIPRRCSVVRKNELQSGRLHRLRGTTVGSEASISLDRQCGPDRSVRLLIFFDLSAQTPDGIANGWASSYSDTVYAPAAT